MMLRWVKLGEKISEVGVARCPPNNELALPNAILGPVKAHVYRFGPLGLNNIIRETHCTHVVRGENSGLLWVAEVGKSLTRLHCLLAGFKNSCPLCLAGGAGDHVRAAADDVDETVAGRLVFVTL